MAYLQKLLAEASWWDAVGYAGQLIFFSRFVVQWIASERRKESVVPISFWYLSIIGSLICLAYALTTFKIPFILAYLFNCIPYVRNLMLIYAKRAKDGPSHAPVRKHVEFKASCSHGDKVVAICTRCGDLQCATCARAREGLCNICAPAPQEVTA